MQSRPAFISACVRLSCLGVFLAVAACSSSAPESQPATRTSVPSTLPSTHTPLPPSSTHTPSPVPPKSTVTTIRSLTPIPSSETVWVDNFEESLLDDAWLWIGNDPSHWSLTARSGYLMITTTSSSGPEDPVNELLQPLPAADFSIQTRLSFNPIQDFHFAGLMILRNGDNFVRLGELYSGAAGGPLVAFDKKQSGAWSDLSVKRPDQEFLYLRIDRFGSTFDGYLSSDGIDWILLGSHTVQFTPTRVGLYTGDGRQNTEEIPALFDYFVLQR